MGKSTTGTEIKIKTLLVKRGPERKKLIEYFEREFDGETESGISFYVEDESHAIKTVELSDIKLTRVGHIDNSGQLFDLKGYCYWRFNEIGSFKSCDFEACYNTSTRNGTIILFIVSG